VLHEDIQDDSIDLSILYEKEDKKSNLERVEKLSIPDELPVDFHLIQTHDDGGELEGFDMNM